MPDPIALTLAITADGLAFILESSVDTIPRMSLVELFRGMTTEPGLYKVEVRRLRLRRYNVQSYSEVRMIPSGITEYPLIETE